MLPDSINNMGSTEAGVTLVRLVDLPLNLWGLISSIVGALGVAAAFVIAILGQKHDARERDKQRVHDADERANERQMLQEAELALRERTQMEHDLSQARNVVGGVPRRLRPYAGQSASPDPNQTMGPAVINASDSVITEVRLIGAWAPLDNWSVMSGRQMWYHRRRMGDGYASLVLPHDEVEFVSTWLQEFEDTGAPGGWQSVGVEGVTPEMITGLQVAIEWRDSRGQVWIRLGSDEPRLSTKYSISEMGRIEQEWRVRNNPEG